MLIKIANGLAAMLLGRVRHKIPNLGILQVCLLQGPHINILGDLPGDPIHRHNARAGPGSSGLSSKTWSSFGVEAKWKIDPS